MQPNELKSILFNFHGLTFSGFARKEGFEPITVIKTVERHWGKETEPKGKKTLKILALLKKYCEQKGATHVN